MFEGILIKEAIMISKRKIFEPRCIVQVLAKTRWTLASVFANKSLEKEDPLVFATVPSKTDPKTRAKTATNQALIAVYAVTSSLTLFNIDSPLVD